MFRKLLFVCFGMAFVLAFNLQVALADVAPQSCTGEFEGNVTQGPDTGTVLAGTITLSVNEHGRINGVLVQNDHSSVHVVGSFHNQTIRLKFALPIGQVRGVGQLPGGFTPCTSNFGGQFKGPKARDRGDWGIIWGS